MADPDQGPHPLTLRPMRADEFPAAIAESWAWYERDMQALGGIPEPVARQRAAEGPDQFLPQGLDTPGQFLFILEEDGRSVGRLWLAEREVAGYRVLYVYELLIAEEHRGRGLGRAAMRLAEREARERGIGRLELNVFGANDVARGLYRSLGYVESAIYMYKELD